MDWQTTHEAQHPGGEARQVITTLALDPARDRPTSSWPLMLLAVLAALTTTLSPGRATFLGLVAGASTAALLLGHCGWLPLPDLASDIAVGLQQLAQSLGVDAASAFEHLCGHAHRPPPQVVDGQIVLPPEPIAAFWPTVLSLTGASGAIAALGSTLRASTNGPTR